MAMRYRAVQIGMASELVIAWGWRRMGRSAGCQGRRLEAEGGSGTPPAIAGTAGGVADRRLVRFTLPPAIARMDLLDQSFESAGLRFIGPSEPEGRAIGC